MAKTQVIDSADASRVPFLRGILTRSLQNAGLSFEDAYLLASTVRQELGELTEVTTDQLREAVLRHLRSGFDPGTVRRYLAPRRSPVPILVRGALGELTPFSRSRHQRCLESCGIASDEAATVTARIFDQLVRKDVHEITSHDLMRITYLQLRDELGAESAQGYLVWMNFVHSGRPLLLLIGGTPGCGKSTIATELANRLDIVRTQSTDMLREVMRMMIPSRLLPVLHTSSFRAWTARPRTEGSRGDPEELLADGYRTQADLVAVACEAVIQRAVHERVSLILEGVHIHPAFLERIPRDVEATVVLTMLAALKPEQLRQRFRGRGSQAPQRMGERYLENFDAIWQLQAFLLSEADRARIPIIPNEDKEVAVHQVMRTIIDQLSRDFSMSPEDVLET